MLKKSLFLILFLPALVHSGQLNLPDDKLDTPEETFAIQHNFEELYRRESGGTPGGSSGQVQFNSGGQFAGDAELTYNQSTNALTVSSISVTYVRPSTISFSGEWTTNDTQIGWEKPSIGGVKGFGYSSTHNSIAYFDSGISYVVFRGNVRAAQATTASAGSFCLDSQNTCLYGDSSTWGLGVNAKRSLSATTTQITIATHTVYSGNAPSVSSCGSSPTIVGNDNAGIITVGSGGVSACTITFSVAWPNTAICTSSVDVSTMSAANTSASTTANTFGFNSALGAGGKVYYRCTSYQ